MVSAASATRGHVRVPMKATELPSGSVVGRAQSQTRRSTMASVSNPVSGRPSHPTVLVVTGDSNLRQFLASGLQEDRCLVLEADRPELALHLVIGHSRPIHILLIDAKIAYPAFEETLKQYRPLMQVLHIARDPEQRLLGILAPDVALAKIRELLQTLMNDQRKR